MPRFGVPSRDHSAYSGRERASTIPPGPWGEPSRAKLEFIAMSPQIHTYAELRQQIHHDLRIQHPDWVQPNGESPMCDSYEARLMQLLGASIPQESNESVGAIDRAIERGRN